MEPSADAAAEQAEASPHRRTAAEIADDLRGRRVDLSLDRTERVARERLGMVPARVNRYVSVSVEAPSGALLPRPLVQISPEQAPAAEEQPWWRTLIQALPLP